MTPNRSLDLSFQLKDFMRKDLLHQISEDFPYYLLENQPIEKEDKVKRDRVYNEENTLLTMLVSAISVDKSLKQSVIFFKNVFEYRGKQLKEKESKQLDAAKIENLKNIQSGVISKIGRPETFQSKIPKSKTMELSDNTAAYSKARDRIKLELVKSVFEYSKEFEYSLKWHGMTVFSTDGTYIQMQDTPKIREKYYVKENDGAYPQGLLQSIIRQGSGQVHAFSLGTRHQSELELVKPLLDKLPEKSLLLADDLYSTYAIFGLMKNRGQHLIVPGKRDRNYTSLKQIEDGDQIVEISKTEKPDWLTKSEYDELPNTLIMRRISYQSPVENKLCVLYSSILDENITKIEIILKYTSRWDIEITIREIKTIMGINIARSKTVPMVDKEITIALTSYNMIRKLITKSVQETDFPPKENIFSEFTETSSKLLVDKKGRVYNHWSTGRYG